MFEKTERMSTTPDNLTLSEQLYRWCLNLYPRAYREEYGPLMLQLFGDLYHADQSSSPHVNCLSLIRLWLRVLPDIGTSASREHFAEIRSAMMNTASTQPKFGWNYLLAVLLTALGILANAIFFRWLGSIWLGTSFLILAHLAAAILIESTTQSKGATLTAMLILLGSILLPLLWTPDAARWLRENPLNTGFLIIISGAWLKMPQRRWAPLIVAGILAAAHIAISIF